jgi:cyclic pyranopterin phosphate synthase
MQKRKGGSLTHLNEAGEARMVDVGAKPVQTREAKAEAWLFCEPSTLRSLKEQGLPKGDVLAVARIAGIQAAKKTSDLIPLCHQLPLESVKVEFSIRRDRIRILTTARTSAKTGVEMEALMAASTAGLTLYDMMKAVDKTMRLDGLQVIQKLKR